MPSGRLPISIPSVGVRDAVEWPTAGELYWAPSHLFPGDPEVGRPLVVLETPQSELERVEVITRTHDLSVRGVPHPADPKNGCTLDGVFALKHFHRLSFDDFMCYARHLGQLQPPDVFNRILDRWRNS